MQKRTLPLFFLFYLLIACSTTNRVTKHSEACLQKQQVAFAFDWDDNIFYMPTKIYLYHNKTKDQVALSTSDFAKHRKQIGVSGPFKNFEFGKNSFLRFGDDPSGKTNFLLEDLKEALKSGNKNWLGPSFESFVKALQHKEIASETYIITARRHSASQFIEALKFLQSKGYIEHLPEEENIWAVNHPDYLERATQHIFEGKKVEIKKEQRKSVVMQKALDELSQKALHAQAEPVYLPNGQKGLAHLWGFSDDDLENFRKAQEKLQTEVNAGRWNNIKIVLFYTGINTKETPPHAIVLRKEQSPRMFSSAENNEWKRLLEKTQDCSKDASL